MVDGGSCYLCRDAPTMINGDNAYLAQAETRRVDCFEVDELAAKEAMRERRGEGNDWLVSREHGAHARALGKKVPRDRRGMAKGTGQRWKRMERISV